METPTASAAHCAQQLQQRLQHRLDQLTQPRGLLGRLEALALQIGLIQRADAPKLTAPQLVVSAADHGPAAQGVSACPSEVTAQRVENFLAGGAVVSVLARQHGPAMSAAQCAQAFEHDREVVRRLPANALLLGESGSANTSGAALTWALIDSALRLLNEMASFESAGVSTRSPGCASTCGTSCASSASQSSS